MPLEGRPPHRRGNLPPFPSSGRACSRPAVRCRGWPLLLAIFQYFSRFSGAGKVPCAHSNGPSARARHKHPRSGSVGNRDVPTTPLPKTPPALQKRFLSAGPALPTYNPTPAPGVKGGRGKKDLAQSTVQISAGAHQAAFSARTRQGRTTSAYVYVCMYVCLCVCVCMCMYR